MKKNKAFENCINGRATLSGEELKKSTENELK
jgi:hypothetical protein